MQLTVKPQKLEHRWRVYHGLFELVFESLGNYLYSQENKYLWIIKRNFLILI